MLLDVLHVWRTLVVVAVVDVLLTCSVDTVNLPCTVAADVSAGFLVDVSVNLLFALRLYYRYSYLLHCCLTSYGLVLVGVSVNLV